VYEEVIPVTPQPVIKGKKVVGSRVDTWNRGYKPGGGNLKIYNKGLKFEDQEKPVVETWDETHTIHQGVIQVHTEPEEPEETTVEVVTRPFEIERVSRTVHVTREMKKLPTPPEPVQVRLNLIATKIPSLFHFRLSRKLLSLHRHK
jgi:hypothetical protein